MFRDMGRLAAEETDTLEHATSSYLRDALPRGEYLGWLAEEDASPVTIIGGVGAQLRRLLPRPAVNGTGIDFGPEAIIVNVYVNPMCRRRGVGETLMRALLDDLASRGVRRIVLHATDDGRRLYERLGFMATNEMRLDQPF